jgi:hypothetical protein
MSEALIDAKAPRWQSFDTNQRCTSSNNESLKQAKI